MSHSKIPVRASDPFTSVRAAGRAARFSSSHCNRILTALRKAGESTADELQRLTGLTVVQIDRRLPELLRDGKVRVCQAPSGGDMLRGKFRVWEAA